MQKSKSNTPINSPKPKTAANKVVTKTPATPKSRPGKVVTRSKQTHSVSAAARTVPVNRNVYNTKLNAPKTQPKPIKVTSFPARKQLAVAQSGKPLNQAPSKRRDLIHDRLKKKSPWYDSIMNPQNGGGVKIPDPVGTQTGTFQFIQNYSVPVNGNGVAGLRIVSPWINNFYQGPEGTEPLGSGLNFQTTVAASTASNLLWGLDGTHIGAIFDPVGEQFYPTVQSHRVVSACVIAQAETSSLEDAGEMCAFVTPYFCEDNTVSYATCQSKFGSSLLPINAHLPMISRWYPCSGSYTPFNGVNTINTNEPYTVSYQDFINPTYPHDGTVGENQPSGVIPFEFGVCCAGLKPSVGVIRFQMIVNYEFIPKSDQAMVTTASSPIDPMEVDLVETWVANAPITEVIPIKQASSAPSDSTVPQEPSGFGMIFNVFKELLPLMMG